MAVVSKTMNILEGFVKEGSFKKLLSSRSSFEEELEEMANSPSDSRDWIQELSPVANLIVRRCSRILEKSMNELQKNFNSEASVSMTKSSCYARNILEYCCFKALALSTEAEGHLADKKFRRLTYDMMLAWEAPEASCKPLQNFNEESTVGIEAFSRIAPAVPVISNVIISDNIFEVLTSSTGDRLQFSVYDKYLTGLERAIRKLKAQSESTLLASLRSTRGEKILEVDGTVTGQPVLEHVGVSTWPGRLTLTDHALYFEAFHVVSYDKAKIYDLSEDVRQCVKSELTGPWGTRLFDRAVSYKSISLKEPVLVEFPELKGHTRRDYWLDVIREILYVHRFIRKFNIRGIGRDDILSKAVLGILRVQAVQDINSSISIDCKSLLMFNLCDQLPGGDIVLETLANMSFSRELKQSNSNSKDGGGMHSLSSLAMVMNLGLSLGISSSVSDDSRLLVGEIAVGDMALLERAVVDSKRNYKKVVLAQATVNGVKVEGIDANLAVMQELILPVTELGKWLLSLAYWGDPTKSLVFCIVFSFIIWRSWVGYALALVLVFMAVFIVLTRFCNQGSQLAELKIIAPPPMNKVDQLLAVQNAISQAEVLLQDGNVALLKLRGLFLSIFPQASERFVIGVSIVAFGVAFIPGRYMALLAFLESFTMYSPPRRRCTERSLRRLREWWFSVPAAPVFLEKNEEKDDKKRK